MKIPAAALCLAAILVLAPARPALCGQDANGTCMKDCLAAIQAGSPDAIQAAISACEAQCSLPGNGLANGRSGDEYIRCVNRCLSSYRQCMTAPQKSLPCNRQFLHCKWDCL